MGIFKEKTFSERRSSAADMKKQQLDQFRAALAGPALQERLAERQKIIEARQAREIIKEEARRRREAQEAAERAVREAAEAAARAEREAELERQRAEREASRPRQLIRDLAAYAEMKAARGGRR